MQLLQRGALDLAQIQSLDSEALALLGAGDRAIVGIAPARLEGLLATPALALMRHVPPTVCAQRRRAVRTDDLQVLQTMVIANAVDVIEDQRHPLPSPDLGLPADLASALLDSFGVEPLLQRTPAIGRT